MIRCSVDGRAKVTLYVERYRRKVVAKSRGTRSYADEALALEEIQDSDE